MEFSWLRDLDGPRSVEPCCDAVTLDPARRLLGEGPVRWVVATAQAVTGHIISRVPENGVGPAPFETLRRTAEAVVLLCLCGLADADGADTGGSGQRNGRRTPYGVPYEVVEAVRDFVRRGIPLDRVLRGVRLGHAFLHRALRDAAPGCELPRRLTEVLFEQTDLLSGELAEVYVAERGRWEDSRESARCRLVEAIISGEQADPAAAERILDYPLDQYHMAVILWREGPADTGTSPDVLAERLTAACGGDGLLQVAGHAAAVWMWVGCGVRPDRVSWPPSLPHGWRAAAGPPSFGLRGMQRSHLGARHAARITVTRPADRCAPHYADIRTACLLTADTEQARWYVRETLGALAASDDWSAQLRDTLRCYLASGRSLKTTAEELAVARSTVTYRVKRAQELLGACRTVDPLEVRLALEVMRFPSVLDASPTNRSGAGPGDRPGPMRHMYVKAGLVP
ncbi:PucR family transcriptional regulator [Streptomyces sp. NPDC050759]|uniref:PucR family transcriptional regulator n=1 Tax=Streptomyces sp. NPDC050759 TaxID=3365635 RepID=UPI00378C0DAA